MLILGFPVLKALKLSHLGDKVNLKEHLFTIMAEECTEVAHVISKILRFGLEETGPGHDQTNRERLEDEIADILGMISMLKAEKLINDIPLAKIKAKGERVKKYLEYSKEKGTLE